ncbi:MAG: hypothetical protein ACRD1D_11865 [Acidimicrobiales bacterium]
MREVRVRLSRGRWAVLATVGAFVAGVGAAASACASLATLNLSTGTGEPGAHVTFTGAAFAVPRASTGLTPTPVVVHWQSDDGPVLAEATPDRYGSISASFTVPEARPGTYVIVAVQKTPRRVAGAPPDQPPMLFAEPGTPARASFEVLAPGARPTERTAPPDAADANAAQPQLDSTVWIVLTAAFGAVAMSLFGGGLIAFIHQSRKAREPATARWIPPGW